MVHSTLNTNGSLHFARTIFLLIPLLLINMPGWSQQQSPSKDPLIREFTMKTRIGNGRTELPIVAIQDRFALILPHVEPSFEFPSVESDPAIVKDWGYKSIDEPILISRLSESLKLRSNPATDGVLESCGIDVKWILGRDFWRGFVLEFNNTEKTLQFGAELQNLDPDQYFALEYKGPKLLGSFSFLGSSESFEIIFSAASDIGLPKETFDLFSKSKERRQVHNEGRVINGEARTTRVMRSCDIQLFGLTIPDVDIVEADRAFIGWGLLQRLDFMLDLRGGPIIAICSKVNNESTSHNWVYGVEVRKSGNEFEVKEVSESPWIDVLKPGDILLGGKTTLFQRKTRQILFREILYQQRELGTIHLKRNGMQMELRIP